MVLGFFVITKEPKLSLGEKGLSQAERSRTKALGTGLNPKEMAVSANFSEFTVRDTPARAYEKFGVEDRYSLTKWRNAATSSPDAAGPRIAPRARESRVMIP